MATRLSPGFFVLCFLSSKAVFDPKRLYYRFALNLVYIPDLLATTDSKARGYGIHASIAQAADSRFELSEFESSGSSLVRDARRSIES